MISRTPNGESKFYSLFHYTIIRNIRELIQPLYYIITLFFQGSRVRSYEFGYGVMDQDSGNRYFHAEKLNDGTKEGSYKIQLPDGRIQTVKYTADSTGFHPKVTYEGKAQYPETHKNKEEKQH